MQLFLAGALFPASVGVVVLRYIFPCSRAMTGLTCGEKQQ